MYIYTNIAESRIDWDYIIASLRSRRSANTGNRHSTLHADRVEFRLAQELNFSVRP